MKILKANDAPDATVTLLKNIAKLFGNHHKKGR